MARIVKLTEVGDSSVLKLVDEPVEEPKEGEVRIRVQAIGLNRAEVLFRQGRYLEKPIFPARIGYEASGVVEALGWVPEGHISPVCPRNVSVGR